MRFVRRFCSGLICFWLAAGFALGQSNVARPLVTAAVDETRTVVLHGNTHPLAQARFDRGGAPADMAMQRMLLVLRHSEEQESALFSLLDQQQDKNSPLFHQWLTPEQFGQQFGPADSDVAAVTLWLRSHGFELGRVSQGRSVIEFSGTVGQIQDAFHTAIHRYVVKGEEHWANARDPQIPSAFASLVAGVSSLHNFRRKAMNHFAGRYSRSKQNGTLTRLDPQFTFSPGGGCFPDGKSCNALGPYDFATIYNVLPLWNAGIDGTGETIAIVGRTNINPQDARDFRASFGLPANDPEIVLNGPDPGINQDEGEADIDVQWSGAVARNATIKLVVSESTETTDGVDLSAIYIVDNNLAPVMSESYGLCELGLGTAGNQFYNALWQQAAAQGITVLVSTGDNGAAGCDFDAAEFGLAVNGIASTPFNVAVGGTDFNDLLNPQTYWNPSNAPTTQVSAKGYVPETTWNDSCTNGTFFSHFGFSSNAETNCNDSDLSGFWFSEGGSGGKSGCTTSNGSQLPSCSGGYGKPSWQAAPGVPADGKRDIPDVSLFASDGFVRTFYVVCQSGPPPSIGCDLNAPYFNFAGYGGTSVSSPAFAGIMALVNQNMGARQGNANYVLYKLAARQSAGTCNASAPANACVFHDVTLGTIAMPCVKGSANCTTLTATHARGVLSGYNAATGYDLATGLGTVNTFNLVNQWNTITFTPTTTTLNLNSGSAVNITHGQPVSFNASVAPQSGTGTPSGAISLLTSSGTGLGRFSLTAASVSASTNALPGGTYAVTAHYSGDGTFGGSDSAPPVSVTVGTENSKTALHLVTADWNGTITSTNASSVVYGSPYLLRVEVTNLAGASCQAQSASCASGLIALTDNSSALDAGTYALNSLGYTEDQVISLTGGSHTVQAQYTGDSSYNASSTSSAISVTPAPTTMPSLSLPLPVSVGSQFRIAATVQAQSLGAPPGGSTTFLADGVPMTGTTTVVAQTVSSTQVQTTFYFSSSFSTSGPRTITANYAGDGNYASASATGSMSALYFTSTNITASPLNPDPGQSVTVIGQIDAPSTGPQMSGRVTFSGNPQAITSTPVVTPITTSSGNRALQATLSFTPSVNNEYVFFTYAGDANYSASNSNAVQIAVAGSDFNLLVGSPSLTVATGGSSVLALTVDGQSNYTGTANFSASSCSGLPAESSCSFYPPSITGTGSTNLTLTTTLPHQVAMGGRSHAYGWLAAALGVSFLGIVLIGDDKRRQAKFLACLMVLALIPIMSCGGGGGGGSSSHTDPGTPAGTYAVTVTASSGSVSHTATFSLVVR